MPRRAWMIAVVLGTLILAGGAALHAQTAQDWIAEGDSLYAKFDNAGALQAYAKAVQLDSANCEALWKLARAYVDVGETKKSKKERKRDYLTAEQLARKAVSLCPDSANTHFILAVAVGRVALLTGGKKKVELSREVKEEAEKAIAIDPNHDGALHVLARWHREVANLSGFLKMAAKVIYGGLPPASNEKAVEYFKRAIAVNPDHINHHLELGRTYQMMKKYDLARQEYEKVLQLPVKDADDPEHKEEAKKLLEKIKNKH